MFSDRMDALRRRLADADIDLALITDDDNVYYLTGYYDYLHMEFGRPTILVVPRDGDTVLITPTIDLNTARASARVDRIAALERRHGRRVARGAARRRVGRAQRGDRTRPYAAASPRLCRRACRRRRIAPRSRRSWPICG